MLVALSSDDIRTLKEFVPAFDNIGAYVHEGVRITVDPYASAETHEAAENLTEFRDQCIFPEYIETLDSVLRQIKEQEEKPQTSLYDRINMIVHDWFYHRQEELGITDGAEPLDSRIGTLEEKLVNECERVLEWQNKTTKDPKHDMIMQWDMILERDCVCNSREDYASLHDGIRDLVDNFYAQIGEAMGPVCYAGFQLTQALKNKNLSTDWVSNCIQYYQDNWDM